MEYLLCVPTYFLRLSLRIYHQVTSRFAARERWSGDLADAEVAETHEAWGWNYSTPLVITSE